MSDVRKTTNKLLELVEEGVLDVNYVLRAALSYLSEADVHAMAEKNELLDWEDENPDDEVRDEEDDFPLPSMSSMGLSRNWK